MVFSTPFLRILPFFVCYILQNEYDFVGDYEKNIFFAADEKVKISVVFDDQFFITFAYKSSLSIT